VAGPLGRAMTLGDLIISNKGKRLHLTKKQISSFSSENCQLLLAIGVFLMVPDRPNDVLQSKGKNYLYWKQQIPNF